jgi:hypothetical protein
MVTIEHILPQSPDEKCWTQNFGFFEVDQLNALTNSLGNLLALSQPKNSGLQNYCYAKKRANREVSYGYFNGSYSENRVAEQYQDWTFESIKERGLELLEFMEKRWEIRLGDTRTKLQLLNLEFLADDRISHWKEIQKTTLTQDLDDYEIEYIDDENKTEEASRNYWEDYSHPEALAMADSIIEIVRTISEPQIKYNKAHISIGTSGLLFIWCYPRKTIPRMIIRLRVDEERDHVVKSLIEQGVECKKGRWPSMARLHLQPQDLEQNKKAIANAIRIAENHSRD